MLVKILCYIKAKTNFSFNYFSICQLLLADSFIAHFGITVLANLTIESRLLISFKCLLYSHAIII